MEDGGRAISRQESDMHDLASHEKARDSAIEGLRRRILLFYVAVRKKTEASAFAFDNDCLGAPSNRTN